MIYGRGMVESSYILQISCFDAYSCFRATKHKEFTHQIGYSAILISGSNLIVPEVCKLLNKQETHETDGSSQIGLYLKITLVRWVNTALLIFILSPHTQTLSDNDEGTLARVTSLLWVELVFAPIVRTMDLVGFVKKHVLAPRCRTQGEMNLFFQGMCQPSNFCHYYSYVRAGRCLLIDGINFYLS